MEAVKRKRKKGRKEGGGSKRYRKKEITGKVEMFGIKEGKVRIRGIQAIKL